MTVSASGRVRSLRVKAGLILLCASANIYAIETCRRTHPLTKAPTDAVTQHEQRLAGLRGRLPARGVAGYVTDVLNEEEAWRRFATTQYALSPVVLVRSADQDLIVGDFKDPSAIHAAADDKGLTPVEDFGGGVVLFKRK